MRSKSLRRAAAGLSLAVCLSLIHVPAAHAKVAVAHGRGRHLQSQPAGHDLLTTLWSYLVTVLTGTPPPGDQPSSTTQSTATTNADVGASADPNGF